MNEMLGGVPRFVEMLPVLYSMGSTEQKNAFIWRPCRKFLSSDERDGLNSR